VDTYYFLALETPLCDAAGRPQGTVLLEQAGDGGDLTRLEGKRVELVGTAHPAATPIDRPVPSFMRIRGTPSLL
jgi:hypothetical protein